MRRRLCVLGVACVLIPAGTAAAAETRVAGPAGSGSACTVAEPCALSEAMSLSQAGDTVLLRGGEYDLAATLAVGAIALGSVDGEVATLRSDAADPVVSVAGPAQISRVTIAGTGTALDVQSGAVSIVNSVVRATGAGAIGVLAGAGADTTLLHVTALAEGAGSAAVEAAGPVRVRNSALRGEVADVRVTGSGAVEADHSNARDVTAGEGNQSADLGLGPDLVPSAGSPLRDAAVADPAGGAADLAGLPRARCDAPDIGALEFQGSCPAPQDPPPTDEPPVEQEPPPGEQHQQEQPGPPVAPADPPAPPSEPPLTFTGLLAGDFVDPVISDLRAGADRRGRLLVRLTSSEPVLARFVLERRIDGRRSGGRCTPGARRGRRCSRYVVVRRLTRSIQAGAQRVRLGSSGLRSGRYRVTVKARDAARNEAGSSAVTVRVRRRG